MAEDIQTQSPVVAEPEPEAEFDLPTPHEDITAAWCALDATIEIDLQLLTKAEAKRVQRIQRMSVKIIYEQIKYIHDCIFFGEENAED